MIEVAGNGGTLGKLCELSPEFASVMEAARILCKRIVEMGFVPMPWFTGGKGFRVAWIDPSCYLRFNNGDGLPTGNNIATVFMRKYLGDACYDAIQNRCKIDPVLYM